MRAAFHPLLLHLARLGDKRWCRFASTCHAASHESNNSRLMHLQFFVHNLVDLPRSQLWVLEADANQRRELHAFFERWRSPKASLCLPALPHESDAIVECWECRAKVRAVNQEYVGWDGENSSFYEASCGRCGEWSTFHSDDGELDDALWLHRRNALALGYYVRNYTKPNYASASPPISVDVTQLLFLWRTLRRWVVVAPYRNGFSRRELAAHINAQLFRATH